jgi:hypothetical protein
MQYLFFRLTPLTSHETQKPPRYLTLLYRHLWRIDTASTGYIKRVKKESLPDDVKKWSDQKLAVLEIYDIVVMTSVCCILRSVGALA